MASNAETNIAKALELKEEGNAAFKAGEYKQAMVHYHQVPRGAAFCQSRLCVASLRLPAQHACIAPPPRACKHHRSCGARPATSPHVPYLPTQIFMYVHGFSEGSASSTGQTGMPGQTTKPVSPQMIPQMPDSHTPTGRDCAE